MDDLRLNVLMHMIHIKTSYNIFLGRPWVYKNKILLSSYNQYLKYIEDGVERKVVSSDKPFTEAESHFIDVKFYLKNYVVKEKMVDDVITSKGDELPAKKYKVGIKKVITKKPPSISNNINNASLKKKPTLVLHFVLKVKIKGRSLI